MLAVLLALGSAVAYGVSDFVGGLTSRSLPTLRVVLVSQSSALVLVAAYVLVTRTPAPGTDGLWLSVASGVSETVGIAALYRGLAIGTMSIVASIGALAPVIPTVIAAGGGELPTLLQTVGIGVAVVGIAVASFAGGDTASGGEALGRESSVEESSAPSARPAEPAAPRLTSSGRPGSNWTSLGYGLLAAVGFGCFYAATDAASEVAGVPWTLLIARTTAVGLYVVATVAVATAVRGPLSLRGRDLPALVLIGALIVGADAMYAVASTLGLVGVVAVLSALYPLVTIGLARVYLHERLRTSQVAGIALCLCGVVAASAG